MHPLSPAEPRAVADLCPQGLVDLRDTAAIPDTLVYPAGSVVIISGLPGSGKSTALSHWSAVAAVVDPRTSHLACARLMPAWLPYAAYRPWARLRHFRSLRHAVHSGREVLVHDCGSRPWIRRHLARILHAQGRELHLVLLDIGPVDALAGQCARGRWTARRVFDRHCRGLAQLMSALAAIGMSAVPEASSVLLFDRTSRTHLPHLRFTSETARRTAARSDWPAVSSPGGTHRPSAPGECSSADAAPTAERTDRCLSLAGTAECGCP